MTGSRKQVYALCSGTESYVMKLLLLLSYYSTFSFLFPLRFYLLLGTRYCQVSGAVPQGLPSFDGYTIALINLTLRALLCPSGKHVIALSLLHSWQLECDGRV